MIFFRNPYLFVVLAWLPLFAVAQPKGPNLFIEPALAIRFDTAHFKIVNRYTNTVHGMEAYEFANKPGLGFKVLINIECAKPPAGDVDPVGDLQSMLEMVHAKGIEHFKILESDTAVRMVHDIPMIGFTAQQIGTNNLGVMITGYHSTKNDLTRIRCNIEGKASLEEAYKVLNSFFKELKSFDQETLNRDAEALRKQYTVTVKPVAIKSFPPPPPTSYTAEISVREPLQHPLIEVRIAGPGGSWQIYTQQSRNKFPVTFQEQRMGQYHKEGRLVVLTPYGRRVEIPFSFGFVLK